MFLEKIFGESLFTKSREEPSWKKRYHVARICFSTKEDYEAYKREIRTFRKLARAYGCDWKRELIKLIQTVNRKHFKPELLKTSVS